jgi:hypothetical protein
MPVSKLAVVKDGAQLVGDKLFCAYCLSKREKYAEKKRRQKIATAVTAAAIVLIGAGVLIYSLAGNRGALESERRAIIAQADEMVAALERDQYTAASQRLADLKAQLAGRRDLFSEQAADDLLNKPKFVLQTWLTTHFAINSDAEAKALQKLLGFCPGKENDLGRILNVKVSGDQLFVTAVAEPVVSAAGKEEQAPDPTHARHVSKTEDPNEEWCAFLKLLGEQFSEYASFEVKWLAAKDKSEVGTFVIKRDQIPLLDSGVAEVLAQFKRLPNGQLPPPLPTEPK